MSEYLKGKVAVVTGGGRGLGRATALEMARSGAKIVAADIYRDENGQAAADEVVKEIADLGGAAAAADDDVRTVEGAQRIAQVALDNFGRIDILCTYAGNFSYTTIDKLTPEEFDSTISVHLNGTFNCIKAVLPAMMEQRHGRIVTVSSRAAFGGAASAYAAAKAGIMGLTVAVAGEMARAGTGITANCILPSAFTQLFPTQALHPPLLKGMSQPEPETLDPADVAPLVAYLGSDLAAEVSGKFFFVGGGDVIAFADPFAVANMNNFLRKPGRWTVPELADLIQPIYQKPQG